MEMGSSQKIKSYKDLRTWQSARELCLEVYRGTARFPVEERFGLTSQIRRSAISVPSNIAEGFGRQTAKEKHQFYHHSLGSLFELETQLDIANELGYLQDNDIKELEMLTNQCRALLLALLKANETKFSNRKSLISNQLSD